MRPLPDLTAINAADLLLDALGRGEKATPGDPVADLLTAWHTDLHNAPPAHPTGFRTAIPPPAEHHPNTAAAADRPTTPRPARTRRRQRLALRVAAAAVVIIVPTVAAEHASPTSPLWPLTKVMYPQQAEIRATEQAIALALIAAAEGRRYDAQRLLDEAGTHAARVHDPTARQRFRAEIITIRRTLPTAAPPQPDPTTSATGLPPTGLAQPPMSPTPTPTPSRPAPTPEPSPADTETAGAPLEIDLSPPALPALTATLPVLPLPEPDTNTDPGGDQPEPLLPALTATLPTLPLPRIGGLAREGTVRNGNWR